MPPGPNRSLLQAALNEIESWNEPRQWPRPFREIVQHAQLVAAEVRRMEALEQARFDERPASTAAQPPTSPGDTPKTVRLRDVARLLGVSRSTIYKYMNEGNFPLPLKLGKRAVRWRLTDIEAWLDSRDRS